MAETKVEFERLEALTSGSIPFADSNGVITQDNANLFYDNSNNRFGLGTVSPNTQFDITGAYSQRGMAAPSVSPSGQGRMYFDSTLNKYRVSEHGGAYVDLVGGGGGAWEFVETLVFSTDTTKTSGTMPTDSDQIMLVFDGFRSSSTGLITVVCRIDGVSTTTYTNMYYNNGTTITSVTNDTGLLIGTAITRDAINGRMIISKRKFDSGSPFIAKMDMSHPGFSAARVPITGKTTTGVFSSTWTTFTIVRTAGSATINGDIHVYKSVQ